MRAFEPPRIRRGSQTLQRRLFAFFLLFLVAVMSGIFAILVATGVFSAGAQENRAFLENELSHLAAGTTQSTGKLAVEGLALSEKLSALFADKLNGTDALSGDAEKIAEVLQDASPLLLAALEKNTCSGVFLVLDATAGPSLPYADSSRAGLFFKNMEPNAINKSSPTVRYLRGPSGIAKREKLEMLPQWQMEFTVAENDFFRTVTESADAGLPLSRQYYWNPAGVLAGDYEDGVLLCVPVLAESGEVLGVCGFEVSAMLFKLQNAPDNSVYNRVFALWAPEDGEALRVGSALLAGSHMNAATWRHGTLSAEARADGLTAYTAANGEAFIGAQTAVNLYPRDAVFADREWAIAVVMPEADFTEHIQQRSRGVIGLLAALFALSAGAALVISRRFTAPVLSALDKVRLGAQPEAQTRIQEIDDLFAYLAEKDAEAAKVKEDDTSRYEAFVESIASLSPAERTVFNLYTEGYDAKRITEVLCLSINTIKTHNRRIFQKLNVSSRKELLVYVQMMRERNEPL